MTEVDCRKDINFSHMVPDMSLRQSTSVIWYQTCLYGSQLQSYGTSHVFSTSTCGLFVFSLLVIRFYYIKLKIYWLTQIIWYIMCDISKHNYLLILQSYGTSHVFTAVNFSHMVPDMSLRQSTSVIWYQSCLYGTLRTML
jgi:hypothetical protein